MRLHVDDELYVYLRRVFPSYFAETNVHPIPVWIDYENKNGVVMAGVKLRWQHLPDFKEGRHLAHFTYQKHGLNYQWYCTSGLPGD